MRKASQSIDVVGSSLMRTLRAPRQWTDAMIQLNPPLPMNTPKGEGFAHILIDYGPESDLYWTVFITETGEVWTFANRQVRASKNITLGRTHPGKPHDEARDPVPMRPVG
jgi:hypothetical protein